MIMSWGNKLVAVFSCFVALMAFMVYNCFKVPVNLVSKEYYKDELAYQQVIDGKNRLTALGSDVKLYEQEDVIMLQLPVQTNGTAVTGKVWFYCASSADQDLKFELQPDGNGRQFIDRDSLMPGNYQVKVDWKSGEESYYSDQLFTVK
jgi:nitrogen fixation protein FixH